MPAATADQAWKNAEPPEAQARYLARYHVLSEALGLTTADMAFGTE